MRAPVQKQASPEVAFAPHPARSSVALTVTAVAAAAALLYFFSGILAPLCMAAVIVVVIHWIADSVTRLLPRAGSWAVTISTGLLAAAAILTGFGIISGGAARVLPLTDRIGGRVQELADAVTGQLGIRTQTPFDIRTLLDQAHIASFVQAALQQTANGVSTVGLTLVFVAFLVAARHKLRDKVLGLARSSEDTAEVQYILDQVTEGVRQSVLVQLKAAGITALFSGLLMWAVGMPDPVFWSVVVFLIAYVPVIGGVIAALVVGAFALVELPSYLQAATVFVGILGFYLLVGSFLVPRMQSTGTNVDPVLGLVFVAVWTVLWGVPGALLANALTVMMMVLFAEFEGTRWVAVLLSNDGRPGGRGDPHAAGD